jgi:hypothetical protein
MVNSCYRQAQSYRTSRDRAATMPPYLSAFRVDYFSTLTIY